jgi:hypothetical protein
MLCIAHDPRWQRASVQKLTVDSSETVSSQAMSAEWRWTMERLIPSWHFWKRRKAEK